MAGSTIRLGPFDLHELIGRGGMAEVWRGEHVGQRIPVAIKVITAKRAREPRFLVSFRNEVQAVARLHHPGVVLVLDHGEVSEAAEDAASGKLSAGSPYLAMEMASWGSLDRVRVPLRWNELVRMLLSLLDALAHAHARGVIHRDLKPGNVLLSSPEDPRPGLKLTDFGIAHALEQDDDVSEEHAGSGTPHFMAPEQFMGSWRDYGPWTDLYAVGCLAYVLATGNLPFQGDSAVQLAYAHMHQTPPKIEEGTLPESFASWVYRLMQKDLRKRFLRASDAGWALMRIDETRKKKRKETGTAEEQKTRPELRLSQETSPFSAPVLGGSAAGFDIQSSPALPTSCGSRQVSFGAELNEGEQEAETAIKEAPERVDPSEHPTEISALDGLAIELQRDQVDTKGIVGAEMPAGMSDKSRGFIDDPDTPERDLPGFYDSLEVPEENPAIMATEIEAVDLSTDLGTNSGAVRLRAVVPGEAESVGEERRRSVASASPYFSWADERARAAVEPKQFATLVRERAQMTLPWAGESAFTPAGLTPPPTGFMSITSDDLPLFPRRIPPLPSNWRRTAPPGPPMKLVGAGLGLYGLRAIPMVDRDHERDTLWSALRDVRETRCARCVVLHGAAGNGKTRLVEWITQRFDEVGSAILLKAVHSPISGPSDGLPRMVARHLRCVDLKREEVMERARSLLEAEGVSDPYEWQALTELMHPISAEQVHGKDKDVVRFSSATERHVLVRRLLERATQERPVIVCLEDVQWGSDAIAFAHHVIKEQTHTPSPILILMTVRDEALADRLVEEKLLGQILSSELCSRLPVPTLSPNDQRNLVNELLVLDEQLASEVADRTDGNPLFAVQLVGDWVQRGVLEVGESGFVLQTGEKAVLPDDIHQVWSQRIDRVLSDQPASARVALELAAILGSDIDAGEWAAACKEANVDLPRHLLDALTENRLADVTEGGFAFAHGMLRESLERSAREAGRFAWHQRTCARMLERKYGSLVVGVPERLGRHYLAAGELERALEPLALGAAECIENSEFPEARALLGMRESAMESLGAKRNDRRWGEGWVLAARVLTVQGKFEQALDWAERAEKNADRYGWAEVLPKAITAGAHIAYQRGDQTTAIEAYQRSLLLFEANKNVKGVSECLWGLGESVYRLGDLAGSESYCKEGLRLVDETIDPVGTANLLSGQGYVEIWRGNLDGALACFERQHAILVGLGNRFELARCVSALGEVARQKGDLAKAESHYRRALSIDEAIGSASAWVDKLNVGLVLLARGEFDEARRLVSAVYAELKETGEPSRLCVVHVELLPCLAAHQEWERWDLHYSQMVGLLHEIGMKDGDLAWLLQLAGERALIANDKERARRVYNLSLSQWEALERDDKVAEVEKAIALLDEP